MTIAITVLKGVVKRWRNILNTVGNVEPCALPVERKIRESLWQTVQQSLQTSDRITNSCVTITNTKVINTKEKRFSMSEVSVQLWLALLLL